MYVPAWWSRHQGKDLQSVLIDLFLVPTLPVVST